LLPLTSTSYYFFALFYQNTTPFSFLALLVIFLTSIKGTKKILKFLEDIDILWKPLLILHPRRLEVRL